MYDGKYIGEWYIYDKSGLLTLLSSASSKIDNRIKNDIYNKTVSDVRKKNENKLLRFNSSDYSYYDTRPNYYYVIFHLIILFLSILIGSCVI